MYPQTPINNGRNYQPPFPQLVIVYGISSTSWTSPWEVLGIGPEGHVEPWPVQLFDAAVLHSDGAVLLSEEKRMARENKTNNKTTRLIQSTNILFHRLLKDFP